MPIPRNCDAHMPGAGPEGACSAPLGLLSPTVAMEVPVDIVLPRFGGGGGGSPFPLDSSFPSAECAAVSGGGGGAAPLRPDIATDGTRERPIGAGIRGSPPFIAAGTFGTKRPLAEAVRLSGGGGGGGGGGGALCESGRFGAERRRGAGGAPLPPPLPFEWLEVEAAPFPPNEALPPPACPLLPPALFRFLDELDLDGEESTIWFRAAVSRSSPEPDDAPASGASASFPRPLRLLDMAHRSRRTRTALPPRPSETQTSRRGRSAYGWVQRKTSEELSLLPHPSEAHQMLASGAVDVWWNAPAAAR